MTRVQHLKGPESTDNSRHVAPSLPQQDHAATEVSSTVASTLVPVVRDHIRELGGFTAMLVNGSAVGIAVLALVKLIGMTNGVWG